MRERERKSVLENCKVSALSRASCPSLSASRMASELFMTALHVVQRVKALSSKSQFIVAQGVELRGANLLLVMDRLHRISSSKT